MTQRAWHYFCTDHWNMVQRTAQCIKCSLMHTPCVHITDPRVAVMQQPVYPTVPSCSWCQTPLGKEQGLIYLPLVIHVTLSESVMGYIAKHSHRQERTSLTAQKTKGELCLNLQQMHQLVPMLKNQSSHGSMFQEHLLQCTGCDKWAERV